MNRLENILDNNLKTLLKLIEASEKNSRAIILLSERITTLVTEKAELTARVEKLEKEKAQKKETSLISDSVCEEKRNAFDPPFSVQISNINCPWSDFS
jgi:hypothetical protein